MVNDCNVAVIGGAGFLGSHLVDHLIADRHCKVLVLDNLISGQKKHLHTLAKFLWHDIRSDENELIRIFGKHDIEYVMNFAAEPYIPECFERPMHFFEINATAVLKVLNAVQKSPTVKRLLQVSSAEIYGDVTGKITEDSVVTPHSTYGVSKCAADGLVQVRFREANVQSLALRQFNCIGPRESHEYIVPELISRIHEIPEYGKGKIRIGNNSTRDFLYAGDQVKIAVELLEKGKCGEVYNLGSEECIKIHDLAHLIAKLMHREIELVQDKNLERPWEIWNLLSDNTKIWNIVGRRKLTPLSEALQKTIDYFYTNGCKWDY